MHHVYTAVKGDQLCPLGFHPQVRWPTRCKRCFRDYKEHGSKRGDDVAASSPSLSDAANFKNRDTHSLDKSVGRSWTSTSNLSTINNSDTGRSLTIPKRPSSWTSTPDLDESHKTDVTVNVTLPRRRHTTVFDASEVEESIVVRRPPLPPSSKEAPDDLVILRTDSLAERARKMQLLKRQSSSEREGSRERSQSRSLDLEKEKSPLPEAKSSKKLEKREKEVSFKSRSEDVAKKKDVQFLIQIKDNQKKLSDDTISMTTETTDTTLVDTKHYQDYVEQIESLKQELEQTKARAERAERDKSDILLRRLASMDTVPNRTAASEALKLQQKVNELKQQLEDLQDDKKSLTFKVKELEHDLQVRPTRSSEEELRKKMQAAETLCEELMDENEDMKKELRNMEQEIDEMQDNFREDQADEYTGLKKELEQTTKNCRILSFKYKKSERRIEQLEQEKQNAANQIHAELMTKVKKLEEELRIANEVARQLQSEVDNNTLKVPKGKTPTLGQIGKSTSADGKISRGSLTRGGSQEDPVQLLRDLQDSMEREADIREQLTYAQEEAENVRKKAARVEDENESLMMQLKKMASRARSRKLSPSQLTVEAPLEKDEGISDEEDPAELRVLLELNEQESSQLRRKVEELENNYEASKNQIKELQEKVKQSTKQQGTLKGKLPTFMSKTSANDKEMEKKLKDLDKDIVDLKKQILDKDKLIKDLQTKETNLKDLSVLKQQNVDFKNKIDILEPESKRLKDKLQILELENEKFTNENKKLALHAARLAKKDSNTLNDKDKLAELVKVKDILSKVEKEKDDLASKLKMILEIPPEKMAPRIPKKYSDSNTKMQLQKILDEQENEIKEMRAIVLRTGADKLQKLDLENKNTLTELNVLKEQLAAANAEITSLKSKNEKLDEKSSKLNDFENKNKKLFEDTSKLQTKIKDFEDQISKQNDMIKDLKSSKTLLEKQMKFDQDKYLRLETESDKEKKERTKCESKISDLNKELSSQKTSSDKTKATLEKEISNLKAKAANTAETRETKKLQELRKQINELQAELDRDKMRYSDLNGKYEHLEEEHILTKAQLTSEKEKLHSDLSAVRTKLDQFTGKYELTLKDKTDLIKKYADAQSKLSDLERRGTKLSTLELENNRMRSVIVEKEKEYRNLKNENEMNQDVGIQLKKEIEELRGKLADFDKVNKVQNTLNDHSSNLEQEIKRLTQRLEAAEISGKSDVAATRLRYEQQVKNLHEEMNSMQRQCERFKRDRDTFKQLLEGAQKTIGELKNNNGRMSRASINSGEEDDKSKIAALEQQVGCLEDELSEARLEASKVKTELVAEKSVFEIKVSEMQSRLNEYEEDRLISSGRAKVAGLKTKLELSWQKEREDQQRILQETSTLARDLRQTLFEVERERDKERLESRRKLEMLKKANDEELDEGRKKIAELQCDLLELRDAHAKLRTTNEKLRRERERHEREKEVLARRRSELEGDRRLSALLETVDELVKITPNLLPNTSQPNPSNNPSQLNPVPPRRSPSPSRTTSQMSSLIGRLADVSKDIKNNQRFEEERDRSDRLRRSSMRRAASTETDTPEMGRHTTRLNRSSTQNGSLYRKSISFDQSIQQEQKSIWKHDDGSMSSIQSVDSDIDRMMRHSSMDSRLSGGSTQSDMPRGPRKKKRGLMGKLRSLTKGMGAESEGSVQGSDSDVSISSDYKSSKTNLKGKLSGMFKRSSSASRDSVERTFSDSTQRPVSVTSVNISNGPPQLPPQIPPPTTPRIRRSSSRPPTPSNSSTPSSQKKAK